MRTLILLCLAAALHAQTITVNASKTEGSFKPIYRYFGYDEPNYTYMPTAAS